MPSADDIWNEAVAAAERMYEESQRDPEAEALEREQKLKQLSNELLTMKIAKAEEELLRVSNPGLNDLWDKYQVMLKLVKDDSK